MRNLYDALLQSARDGAAIHNTTLRFGEVTAVSSGTLTVRLAGEEIPFVPYMRGSNPQVGDWAWLLHQGSLLVCIGFSDSAVPTTVTATTRAGVWGAEPRPWKDLPPTNSWTGGP